VRAKTASNQDLVELIVVRRLPEDRYPKKSAGKYCAALPPKIPNRDWQLRVRLKNGDWFEIVVLSPEEVAPSVVLNVWGNRKEQFRKIACAVK